MTYWTSDPDDYRVIAALAAPCGICNANPGIRCSLPGFDKLPSGAIIHQARVPAKVLGVGK